MRDPVDIDFDRWCAEQQRIEEEEERRELVRRQPNAAVHPLFRDILGTFSRRAA